MDRRHPNETWVRVTSGDDSMRIKGYLAFQSFIFVFEPSMDVRVLDYIDDRLATSSDFDALDSLIENVKEQQDLLKKQVI
jgi:hypothetical protein